MILGIDLGTSNSMAAVYRNGEPVIIENRFGKRQIPSVVTVDERDNFFAGQVAQERQMTYPEQTVSAFKRSMGTETTFTIGGKNLRAVELSAIILRNIKEDAERFLGEAVDEAVISVPAFFSNPQRKAVIQAGELAGVRVRQLINEPTAAAMAYGIQNREAEEESGETHVLMVMDLGGGTFDISIVEQTGDIMEVVAVCGDNHLGGEDFTRRLMELFLAFHGIGEIDKKDTTHLWKQAEQAKKMFASKGMGSMHCVMKGENYDFEISEQDYEKACFDLLEKMRKLALKAVAESKYEMEDINEILMVGGGMKLTIIRKMIQKLSGQAMEYKIDPDEAVVMGAALTGYLAEQDYEVKDLIMTDICPYDLGYRMFAAEGYDLSHEFHTLIKRNTTIPVKRVHHMRVGAVGMHQLTLSQANDSYVDEAIELGEVEIIFPKTLNGYNDIDYTAIYDVNGIIKFELYVKTNNLHKETLVCNENCELTREEAEQRMKELAYLKASPLEEEVNQLVYARAERLYEECFGREREQIGTFMKRFEEAIVSDDNKKIEAAREALTGLLDMVDNDFF